jgi:hypothetical protein
MTIKNSLTYGIFAQYVTDFYIQNVVVQTSAYATYQRFTYNSQYESVDAMFCAYGHYNTNANYFYITLCGASGITTGNGFDFYGCNYFSAFTNFAVGNSAHGFSLNYCDIGTIKACVANNGVRGVFMDDGNRRIVIEGGSMKNNSGNGIYLDNDNDFNVMTNNILADNGAYGIRINDATNADNLIGTNLYDGNTSGDWSDAGTNTRKPDIYETDTTVQLSSAAEVTTVSLTYTKVKEILCYVDGQLTIAWYMKLDDATDKAWARVYINGVAKGAEKDTQSLVYVEKSSNLAVKQGDYVQIYAKREDLGGAATIYVKDFEIRFKRTYGLVIT